jgi:uncharacterized protein YidB (DUF937 family)
MGLLDSIEGMAMQGQGGADGSPVAGGVLQAMEEHPGGLSGILDSFRNNGMSSQVQNWASGQQTTATPDEVQQGLGGSRFLENVAAKAHVSPEVAKIAVATVLPMVIAHFTHGGTQEPPTSGYASGFGGLASQLLGKIL